MKNLKIIDRETWEAVAGADALKLTSTYCSGCGTFDKEVGAYPCNGDKIHKLHNLLQS